MKSRLLKEVFEQYRKKGLLIDSNLLLLFFADCANPELISSFKSLRSHQFTDADFRALGQIVYAFRGKNYTTPNILTEVSNLSSKLHGEIRALFFRALAHRVREIKEEYIQSLALVEEDCFLQFGLTDTAIAKLAPGTLLVLTIDFALAGYLRSRKIDVINFKELRELWSKPR